MRSKLINVRLGSADASKADALKAEGVNLSNVVRDAIRSEYVRRGLGKQPSNSELLKRLDEVFAKYPIPDDVPKPVNTAVRAEAQRWIRKQLERKLDRSRPTAKRRKAS
jgi:hypothetical protein